MTYDYLNEVMAMNRGIRRQNNQDMYQRALRLKNLGASAIFNRMCLDKCSIIGWDVDSSVKNLIDTSLIEKTILLDGYVAFYNYNGFPIIGKAGGLVNDGYYNNPTSCFIYDFHGRQVGMYLPVSKLTPVIEQVKDSSCVLVYDNMLKYKPIITVMYYCERLTDINAQINGAIKNILGTTVFNGTRNQMAQIEKMYAQACNGKPYFIDIDEEDNYNGREMSIVTSSMSGADGASLKILMEAFDKTYADYLKEIASPSNSEYNKLSGISSEELELGNAQVYQRGREMLNERNDGINLMKLIGIDGVTCRLIKEPEQSKEDERDNGGDDNAVE